MELKEESRQNTSRLSTPTLNIYSSPSEHQECYIVGNRRGLESLKKAIDEALNTKSPHNIGVTKSDDGNQLYASDGEGYTVVVIMQYTKLSEDPWNDLTPPYVDTLSGYSLGNAPGTLLTQDDVSKLLSAQNHKG